jgi:hypothetical protein
VGTREGQLARSRNPYEDCPCFRTGDFKSEMCNFRASPTICLFLGKVNIMLTAKVGIMETGNITTVVRRLFVWPFGKVGQELCTARSQTLAAVGR